MLETTFNQTNVELKSQTDSKYVEDSETFNQTNVELKLFKLFYVVFRCFF